MLHNLYEQLVFGIETIQDCNVPEETNNLQTETRCSDTVFRTSDDESLFIRQKSISIYRKHFYDTATLKKKKKKQVIVISGL